MRRALAILFALLLFEAGAATIYIDPTCPQNGDGTAQTCAAAGGATGARNTWAGITWGNNTYLQRGGTTFNVASAFFINGASAILKSGHLDSWGTEPATINCQMFNGASYCMRPAADAVQILGFNHLGCGLGGTTCTDSVQIGTSATNAKIQGNVFIGPGEGALVSLSNAIGIIASVCPITINENVISHYARGITFRSGAGSCGGGEVAKNVIGPNSGTSPSDSDGIGFIGTALWNFTSPMKVSENEIFGFHENAIDVASAANVSVINNTLRDPIKKPDGATQTFILLGAVSSPASAGNNRVEQNYIYDSDDSVDPDGSGVAIGLRGIQSSTIVAANIVNGLNGFCLFGSNGGGANVPSGNVIVNNTFAGCINGAIRIDHGTTYNIRNTAFYSLEKFTMSSDFVSAAGTSGNFTHAISWPGMATTTDGTWTANALSDADPKFVEVTPIRKTGFKLRSGSPMIRAGICYLSTGCAYRDAENRRVRVPPDIGAWQRRAGD